MIIAKIVNGAYKALRGDVPNEQLPYPLPRKGNPRTGRKAYKVYMETYTQLGYSGKTFKRRGRAGVKDNSIKVIRTRGRTYYELSSALKRLQHLEDQAGPDVKVVLVRLWEDNPRLQVIQCKHGLKQKK